MNGSKTSPDDRGYSLVAYPGQELAKEGIGEAQPKGGNDNPQRVGALLLHAPGHHVGAVAHLFGRTHDDIARLLGHNMVVTGQCPGDGGNGKTYFFGDVLKSDAHRIRPNWKATARDVERAM